MAIHHGDLFDVLPTLAENSLEACVTDPPYGIGFMGKQWDNFRRADNAADVGRDSVMGRLSRTSPASGAEADREEFHEWTMAWARDVLRVLKPGAHILAFGGTRTFHRLTCGLEDAGFEIRDCLCWLYGSGFPKSLNVGNGLGTALKPAWEPIVLARKPLDGTVAANVLAHGTGAINVEACRIGFQSEGDESESKTKNRHADFGSSARVNRIYSEHHRPRSEDGNYEAPGRWPANVLLDEAAAALLDAQSGELGVSTGGRIGNAGGGSVANVPTGTFRTGDPGYGDSGGASRFFYVAKPSRAERDRGHYDTRNGHPTVKPIELMRYLVRLITPPGGTVLDPFCGSGTTGMACRYEGVNFVGIERDAAYVATAERRIADCLPLLTEASG